jgi:hypothetical protein
MKTIKSVKSKTTKTATKISAVKTPAAVTPSRTAEAKTVKTSVKAPLAPMTAPRREITSDLIAQRAYVLWEQQGRPQGHDVANWLLAEKLLKQEHSFTA